MSASETSVLSLWISLAAVLVGPIVSLKIAKRQMISPIRQKWIDDLRELLGVILSECQNLIVLGEGSGLLNEEKIDDALFKRLLYLEKKLNLMLDPCESDHVALLHSVNKITDAVHHGVGDLLEFGANVNCTTQLTQKIMKTEWEIVTGKKHWFDVWL